jgi:hypothetical protein
VGLRPTGGTTASCPLSYPGSRVILICFAIHSPDLLDNVQEVSFVCLVCLFSCWFWFLLFFFCGYGSFSLGDHADLTRRLSYPFRFFAYEWFGAGAFLALALLLFPSHRRYSLYT